MTTKVKRIKDARLSDYELSLTKVLGKKIKDIAFYVSGEWDMNTALLTRLIFEDGSVLGFEGAHDHPYLTTYGKNTIDDLDEILEAYSDEEEED